MYSPAGATGLKKVDVVAALLIDGDEVLVAQRKSTDSGGGRWEFPGGKVEAGESLEDALRREIKEELEMEIDILAPLGSHEVITPTQKLIQLSLFAARVRGRNYVLNDHDAAQWVSWKNLSKVPFLQGNIAFIKSIEDFFTSRSV